MYELFSLHNRSMYTANIASLLCAPMAHFNVFVHLCDYIIIQGSYYTECMITIRIVWCVYINFPAAQMYNCWRLPSNRWPWFSLE